MPTATVPKGDERVASGNLFTKFFTKPEAGATAAAIVVFVLFAVAAPQFTQPSSLATTLYGASTVGIMALGVSLLMIGGEFDLSTGVGVISSALAASLFVYWFGTNVWVGVVVGLVFSLGVGALNGWLLMKTKLASFIVTLSTFLLPGASGEIDEGAHERLARTVEVEVLGVDVRDECDRGVVQQERAVGLVRLDDEEIVRT